MLVEAGLTPVEALRSATILPTEFFGFTNRGVIEAGRRADLLLIDGDPTRDMRPHGQSVVYGRQELE